VVLTQSKRSTVFGAGGVELGLERQLAMGTLANAAAVLPEGGTKQRVDGGLKLLAGMEQRLGQAAAPKL
jgi:hypothetical protein